MMTKPAPSREWPTGRLARGLLASLWLLTALGLLAGGVTRAATHDPQAPARAVGVCPPYPLRDETGARIDPIHGENASVPYSPRQTCGASGCHDYARITEGFHFTQGKGEPPPPEFAARYHWVSSPGNYGGTWCSPAPLYRQLAAKENQSARTIDMTSFEFITATCGNCHPGGGPLETDREGKRYDEWMRDPASGLASGGENGLDGDYYKARWSETGVIEADCLLCHMPEYDLKHRNAEIAKLNFRWAATAGAGFGPVSGSVAAGQTPSVAYDPGSFDADGNVIVHIAPEPRNETCLGCHFKPDWKKRGTAYSTRTDVHMVAGLRCVDCHAAGSRAADPRISRREEHQFGKGDDPSGWVRNDLDNTMRSCESCHLTGWRNSPLADHGWLPALHLDRISCQACHIPQRAVKSALVQASDVYNPAPRISPPGKHIWTFYDQDRAFWNHYGELELFTASDAPTNVTRPTLIRYKGKIYPANRVHSAFVGFEETGRTGFDQLFMKDFFKMWSDHRSDPAGKYPELARIADDDRDGALEVNRPEEIDALLAATRAHLEATGFPLQNRRLAWIADSRAHFSSTEVRELDHAPHEATAYASVYKFSHDVAPARAALGAGGCTDCHRADSPFFQGAVLAQAFTSEDGRPQWIPNYQILGMNAWGVRIGAWRESTLKGAVPWVLAATAFLCLLHYAAFGPRRVAAARDTAEVARYRPTERLVHAAIMAAFLVLSMTGLSFFLGRAGPLGEWARGLHAWIGYLFAAGLVVLGWFWIRLARLEEHDRRWLRTLGGYFGFRGRLPAGKFNAGQKLFFWFAVGGGLGLAATGILMSFYGRLPAWMPFVYTAHDLGAALFSMAVLGHLYLAVIANPGSLRAILEGRVSTNWARHHHSEWAAMVCPEPDDAPKPKAGNDEENR